MECLRSTASSGLLIRVREACKSVDRGPESVLGEEVPELPNVHLGEARPSAEDDDTAADDLPAAVGAPVTVKS